MDAILRYKCSQIENLTFSNPNLCDLRRKDNDVIVCHTCPGPIPLGDAPWPDATAAPNVRRCACGVPIGRGNNGMGRATKCPKCRIKNRKQAGGRPKRDFDKLTDSR